MSDPDMQLDSSRRREGPQARDTSFFSVPWERRGSWRCLLPHNSIELFLHSLGCEGNLSAGLSLPSVRVAPWIGISDEFLRWCDLDAFLFGHRDHLKVTSWAHLRVSTWCNWLLFLSSDIQIFELKKFSSLHAPTTPTVSPLLISNAVISQLIKSIFSFYIIIALYMLGCQLDTYYLNFFLVFKIFF